MMVLLTAAAAAVSHWRVWFVICFSVLQFSTLQMMIKMTWTV